MKKAVLLIVFLAALIPSAAYPFDEQIINLKNRAYETYLLLGSSADNKNLTRFENISADFADMIGKLSEFMTAQITDEIENRKFLDAQRNLREASEFFSGLDLKELALSFDEMLENLIKGIEPDRKVARASQH